MVGTVKDRKLCWLNTAQSALQCISMLDLIVSQNLPSLISTAPEDFLLPTLGGAQPESEPMAADQPSNPKSNIPILMPLPSYIDSASLSKILLDWLTDNWYLLDSNAELIYLCEPHLRHCAVIADHRILSRPLSVELDATEGLLFVSRHGDKSRFGPQSAGPAILKMALDGSKVEILVDVRLVKPAQITLDVTKRRLYWIDEFLGEFFNCLPFNDFKFFI